MADCNTNYRSMFPDALDAVNTQCEREQGNNELIAAARDYNIHDQNIQAIERALGTGNYPETVRNQLDSLVSQVAALPTGNLESIAVYEEGVLSGNATEFDFVGDAIFANVAGNRATITVTAGTGAGPGGLGILPASGLVLPTGQYVVPEPTSWGDVTGWSVMFTKDTTVNVFADGVLRLSDTSADSANASLRLAIDGTAVAATARNYQAFDDGAGEAPVANQEFNLRSYNVAVTAGQTMTLQVNVGAGSGDAIVVFGSFTTTHSSQIGWNEVGRIPASGSDHRHVGGSEGSIVGLFADHDRVKSFATLDQRNFASGNRSTPIIAGDSTSGDTTSGTQGDLDDVLTVQNVGAVGAPHAMLQVNDVETTYNRSHYGGLAGISSATNAGIGLLGGFDGVMIAPGTGCAKHTVRTTVDGATVTEGHLPDTVNFYHEVENPVYDGPINFQAYKYEKRGIGYTGLPMNDTPFDPGLPYYYSPMLMQNTAPDGTGGITGEWGPFWRENSAILGEMRTPSLAGTTLIEPLLPIHLPVVWMGGGGGGGSTNPGGQGAVAHPGDGPGGGAGGDDDNIIWPGVSGVVPFAFQQKVVVNWPHKTAAVRTTDFSGNPFSTQDARDFLTTECNAEANAAQAALGSASGNYPYVNEHTYVGFIETEGLREHDADFEGIIMRTDKLKHLKSYRGEVADYYHNFEKDHISFVNPAVHDGAVPYLCCFRLETDATGTATLIPANTFAQDYCITKVKIINVLQEPVSDGGSPGTIILEDGNTFDVTTSMSLPVWNDVGEPLAMAVYADNAVAVVDATTDLVVNVTVNTTKPAGAVDAHYDIVVYYEFNRLPCTTIEVGGV